jgi:hypothetical protein
MLLTFCNSLTRDTIFLTYRGVLFSMKSHYAIYKLIWVLAIALLLPSSMVSAQSSWEIDNWGGPAYLPLLGDVNGDGKADRVVYRFSDGDWGCRTANGGTCSWNEQKWGGPAYLPLLGDVNGDGKDDRVVYRSSDGGWGCWITDGPKCSWDGHYFGGPGYVPLLGDVNGDGKDDQVVYRSSDGHWDNRPTETKEIDDARRAQLMSDDLLFDYTQVFEWVWDDSGSGARRDVGFFKPVPRAGYYALGHYAHASHAMPRDVVIVVKEKKPGALKSPLNYERIWTDSGSGANRDGAVWWPICPSNYVALGLVTTSGAKPPTDAVRCVRQDLTAQAEVGDQIWNDGGSGAKRDFAAWRIKASSAPAGEAYVSPGTFIGHASHRAIGNANARTLKMKLPLFPSPKSLSAPQLTGSGKPSAFENQTITSEVYLPFTVVKDNAWSPAKMAKDSPYYKLVRTDQFKLINHIHNATSTAQSVTWDYSIALQNSESFTHQTGISLTTGYDNKPAGVGYSVSATLSYSFTYQKARSETTTTTISVPVIAQPGKAVAAYVVHSTFQLYRADGDQVSSQATANKPNSFIFVEYPPQ